MDQNNATKHFSNGHRLLLAIGYAGVGYSLRVQPEKIIVLGHQNTSGGCGEFKVRHIGRTDQARIRGGRYVDIAAPQTSRDMDGNMLVKMKADAHRLRCVFQAFLAQPRLDQRWINTANLFGRRTLGAHLLLDFLNVIEIVSEGGVDVGESDRRNVRYDLVGGHALMRMPHHDIEHTDSVACDAGFPAADAGRPGDPVFGRGHDSSII